MKKLRTMMAFMLAAVSIIAVSCSDDDNDDKGTEGSLTPTIELTGVQNNKVALLTGEEFQIVPVLKNSTDENPEFEYKVGTSAIATVSADGLIKADYTPGPTNVSVTYKADPGVVEHFLLEVVGVYVETIETSTETPLINTGDELEVYNMFTILPANSTNLKLDFAITPASGAKIVTTENDETREYSYKFVATLPGTYSVVAKSDQNNDIQSVDPLVITVEQRVTSVEVSPATVLAGAGDELNLYNYFSVAPANSTVQDMTFEIVSGGGSLAENIYTAPTAAGDVVIKATAVDNPDFTNTVTITVSDATAATALTLQSFDTGHPEIPDMIFAYVGGKVGFGGFAAHFNVTPENAQLVFTSDNDAVVKIEYGQPVFVGVGTANITATSKHDTTISVVIPVKVIAKPAVFTTGFTASNTQFPSGYGMALTSIIKFKGSTPTNGVGTLYIRPREPAKMSIAGGKLTHQLPSGQTSIADVFATDGSSVHFALTIKGY